MTPVKLPLDVLTPFSYDEHHRYRFYIKEIHYIEQELELIENKKKIDETIIEKIHGLVLRRSFLIDCMRRYEKNRQFYQSSIEDCLQALVLHIVFSLLSGIYLALNPQLAKQHSSYFLGTTAAVTIVLGVCVVSSHSKLKEEYKKIDDRFNERTTSVLLEKIKKSL